MRVLCVYRGMVQTSRCLSTRLRSLMAAMLEQAPKKPCLGGKFASMPRQSRWDNSPKSLAMSSLACLVEQFVHLASVNLTVVPRWYFQDAVCVRRTTILSWSRCGECWLFSLLCNMLHVALDLGVMRLAWQSGVERTLGCLFSHWLLTESTASSWPRVVLPGERDCVDVFAN